jgi:hypothetical protein
MTGTSALREDPGPAPMQGPLINSFGHIPAGRCVPMRGADEDEVVDFARLASDTATEWAGRRINHPEFVRPARSMSVIGG